MAALIDADKIIANIRKDADEESKKILEIARKIVHEENEKLAKKVFLEFGLFEQNKIREIFKASVDEFYGAYAPHEYKRNYSLYDVLDMKLDDRGIVMTDNDSEGLYYSMLNKDAVTKDRNGNSLFDSVFVKGYHGGSDKIADEKADVWGAHPSPGRPYYRKRGWVKYPDCTKKKIHRYGKWGNAAVVTTSAYKMFSNGWTATWDTEAQGALQKIWDKNYKVARKAKVSRINNALNKL